MSLILKSDDLIKIDCDSISGSNVNSTTLRFDSLSEKLQIGIPELRIGIFKSMPILNSAYVHIVIPCGKVCRIKNRFLKDAERHFKSIS